MLVAEALLLLLLDEEKGSTVQTGHAHDAGLAGALLLDLTAAGLLETRDGKLAAVGAEPSAPALAQAWREIRSDERPRDAKGWLGQLPKGLKPMKSTVAASLVAGGVIGEHEHKRLGLVWGTRYPELDPEPERELRARLHAVLVDGEAPDALITSLLTLLVPMDLVKQVVPKDARKDAKARAKEIAERGAVGDAVKGAVEAEIMAAIMPAISAAVITTTTSS